jgi:glycosyltransferase involved in cell wall biosynthesis
LVCATQRLWKNEMVCSGPGMRCLACASEHYGLTRGVPTVLANWGIGIAERKMVDRFLPVSQAVALRTGLSNNAHSQVIPNFIPDQVDLSEGIEEIKAARLPDKYLLFVGDISVEKGVLVLLKAYKELASQIPLVLIGRQKLSIPEPLSRNVHIIPGMAHGAVMRAWQNSVLGLAPSVWSDPCPTVVMEAMASGRPVVASRIGGLIDLVCNEETGLLVPPGDVDALRDAMNRLLDDSRLGTRMGLAAKERVRAFQAKSVVPQIEQVYRRLAAKRKGQD